MLGYGRGLCVCLPIVFELVIGYIVNKDRSIAPQPVAPAPKISTALSIARSISSLPEIPKSTTSPLAALASLRDDSEQASKSPYSTGKADSG